MGVRVRLLGVGSPRGDDRAGWWFVEALSRDPVPGVEALAIADPIRLLDHLEGVETLIVADACRSGRVPGSIVVRDWPAEDVSRDASSSSHGLGVANVLALADAMGRLPPSVILIAVEAGSCGVGEDLTPDVARALTTALPRVRELLLGRSAPPGFQAPLGPDRGRRRNTAEYERRTDAL